MDHHHLEKVRSGDIEAFRYFVGKYQDMAYAVAMGVLHHREEAEEAVQDAFVRAFQGLAKFRGDAKFSTWFHRIVVNEALRKAQKKKAPIADIPDEQLPDEGSIAESNDALMQLEQKERRQLIRQILGQLKPKEALVLQLHYLQEMPIQEIEDSTGFSIPQIKVLLHRGRKSFYALFQQNYHKELLL